MKIANVLRQTIHTEKTQYVVSPTQNPEGPEIITASAGLESRVAHETAVALGDRPLTIGLPIHVLPYYFPSLYDPSVIGEEYLGKLYSAHPQIT